MFRPKQTSIRHIYITLPRGIDFVSGEGYIREERGVTDFGENHTEGYSRNEGYIREFTVHRTIPCRKKLFEQRIVDSKDCTVCGVVDNLQHFLFECEYVKQFWTMLKTWLYENLEYELELAVKNILFGLSGEGETITVLNYVVIHAKYY